MWAAGVPPRARHALPLLLLLALLASPTLAQSDAQLLLDFTATFNNGATVLSGWADGTDPCGYGWDMVYCYNGRPDEM